ASRGSATCPASARCGASGAPRARREWASGVERAEAQHEHDDGHGHEPVEHVHAALALLGQLGELRLARGAARLVPEGDRALADDAVAVVGDLERAHWIRLPWKSVRPVMAPSRALRSRPSTTAV